MNNKDIEYLNYIYHNNIMEEGKFKSALAAGAIAAGTYMGLGNKEIETPTFDKWLDNVSSHSEIWGMDQDEFDDAINKLSNHSKKKIELYFKHDYSKGIQSVKRELGIPSYGNPSSTIVGNNYNTNDEFDNYKPSTKKYQKSKSKRTTLNDIKEF